MPNPVTIKIALNGSAAAQAGVDAVTKSVEGLSAAGQEASASLKRTVMTQEEIAASAQATAAKLAAAGQVWPSMISPAEIEAANAANGLKTELAEAGAAAEAVGSRALRGSHGIGRLNQTLVGAIDRTRIVSPALGHLSYTLGSMALGSATMIPIMAGLAAISLLFEKIKKDSEGATAAQKAFNKVVSDVSTGGTVGRAQSAMAAGQEELAKAVRDVVRAQQALESEQSIQQAGGLGGAFATFNMGKYQAMVTAATKHEVDVAGALTKSRNALTTLMGRSASAAEVAAAKTKIPFDDLLKAEQQAGTAVRNATLQLNAMQAELSKLPQGTKNFIDLKKHIDAAGDALVAASAKAAGLHAMVVGQFGAAQAFLGGARVTGTPSGLTAMRLGTLPIHAGPVHGILPQAPSLAVGGAMSPVSPQTLGYLREFAHDAASVGETLDQIAKLNVPQYKMLEKAAEKSGMSVEQLAKVLGIDVPKKNDVALKSVIGSFATMADAAVVGSHNVAMAVINAFEQIAQYEAAQGAGSILGFLGPLAKPLEILTPFIGMALAGSHHTNSNPVPVSIQGYSSQALSQQKQVTTAPQAITVQVVSPTTGQILEETQYQLRRLTSRDAVQRIPSGAGLY